MRKWTGTTGKEGQADWVAEEVSKTEEAAGGIRGEWQNIFWILLLLDAVSYLVIKRLLVDQQEGSGYKIWKLS